MIIHSTVGRLEARQGMSMKSIGAYGEFTNIVATNVDANFEIEQGFTFCEFGSCFSSEKVGSDSMRRS